MCKRFTALVLALLTLLPLPALAAEEELPGPITVHAEMWRGWWVTLAQASGKTTEFFFDKDGRMRNGLVYNGTVYVPLRTVGLWMGADTGWTAETATAWIATGRHETILSDDFMRSDKHSDRTELMDQRARWERENGMDVELRPDVMLLLDGAPQHFRNAQGEPIYPIRWNDEVWGDELWVPLRGVAQMMGKHILWLDYGERLPPSITEELCIYDIPTQEELDQAEEGLAAAEWHAAELRALVEELAAMEEVDYDSIQSWIDRFEDRVRQARGLYFTLPLLKGWSMTRQFEDKDLAAMRQNADALVALFGGNYPSPAWSDLRDGYVRDMVDERGFNKLNQVDAHIAEARGLLEGAKAVEAAEE